MPFIPGRCSQCNGEIVQKADGSFKCDNCDTPFYYDAVTNKYVTHIEHLHTDKVVVNDDRSAEQRLEAAESFIKIERWDAADKAFSQACDLTPQDYRSWWGRIRAHTMEFSKYQNLSGSDTVPIKTLEDELKELDDFFAAASRFAPPTDKAEITRTYKKYKASVKALIKKEQEAVSILQAQEDELNAKIGLVKNLQQQHNHFCDYKFKKYISITWILYLIVFIFFGIGAKKSPDSSAPPIVIGIAIASLVIVLLRDLICALKNASNSNALERDNQRYNELSQAQRIRYDARRELEEGHYSSISEEAAEYLREVMDSIDD